MKRVGVTLTGPSGTGKSTLERRLVERHGFARLISTTSRKMRAGERHGHDYFYVEATQFVGMVERGEMVEHVEFPRYSGNFYGVSKAECERAFSENKPFVVVCEPDGAGQFREFAAREQWSLLSVYLDSPVEVLLERVLGRLDREFSDIKSGLVKDLSEQSGVDVAFKAAKEQIDAILAIYEKRCINLLDKELAWRHALPYDLVFDRFDANTQADVIDEILRDVAKMQGVPTLRAV